MPGTDAPDRQHRCVLPFEAVPTEVRLLRRAVGAQLNQWGVPSVTDEAALAVTELATNVIKHVGEGAPATLVLERKSDRVRVEVHDTSCALPTARTVNCEADCGRGLHMLAAMAADWGVITTAVGKVVWCEIAAGSGAACRRAERAVEVLETYRGRDGIALEGRRRDLTLTESAIELIADLLHWTSARGLDPDDVLDRAQMHYEAEVEAA
jgi:anti-sigma regulatory factor (Ser/Thr protein kinase)